MGNGEYEALTEMLLDADLPPVFLPTIEREFYPEMYDLFWRLVSEEAEKVPQTRGAVEAYIGELPEPARHLIRIKSLTGSLSREDIASSLLATELEPLYFDLERYLKNDGKVLQKFHELKKLFDQDSLLPITDEMKLLRNGLSYRGYLIYYHQFMRRMYRYSINWKFFELLQSPAAAVGNRVSLAIDPFRLIRLDKFHERFEEDYWWGPKFNIAKIDDRKEYGFTKHMGSSSTISSRPIRTEFYIQVRGSEKIFEIEEVDLSQGREPDHPNLIINRYVHSIRDMSRHRFIHLDGAAKIYRKPSFDKRIATDLRSSAKSDYYVKLYRIDGDLPDDDWTQLINAFFRQNDDVRQFLGGKSDELSGIVHQA